MTERAVPFHCPFCGDENLRPAEAHGTWECHSCLRTFSLKMLGLLPRPAVAGDPSPEQEVTR
jgi:ribosomal protein L37AE/L43A